MYFEANPNTDPTIVGIEITKKENQYFMEIEFNNQEIAKEVFEKIKTFMQIDQMSDEIQYSEPNMTVSVSQSKVILTGNLVNALELLRYRHIINEKFFSQISAHNEAKALLQESDNFYPSGQKTKQSSQPLLSKEHFLTKENQQAKNKKNPPGAIDTLRQILGLSTKK